MLDKRFESSKSALHDVFDGAKVMIGGQSNTGVANDLLTTLLEKGTKNLTIIANHAGINNDGIEKLIRNRRVKKVICSYPRTKNSAFAELYGNGEIELEIVPQGTLTERIRAGGAGIGGFYTRTGIDTILAEEKETKIIDGFKYLFEKSIKADFSLIKAFKSDRWGNLIYWKAARNFNPSMATAANVTIAEVDKYEALGGLDAESIITPGVFVDRIVKKERRLS